MLRSTFVASAVGILLFVAPAVSRAGASSDSPTQALVRINSSGQLEMLARHTKIVHVQKTMQVMKKELRTETRTETQTIEKDGKKELRTVDVPVTVEVMVPTTQTYTEAHPVHEMSVQKFPASTNAFRRDADKAELPLFDLAGNRLSVTAVEDRLHDWTLVLISPSGKALDRKFAAIFKPTTIVIGVPPMTAMAPMPMPAPGYIPAPQPVVPSGVPAPAAGLIEPSKLSPVAFFADDAMPQLPNSTEPTFASAKVWGDKTLALRTESEQAVDLTCMVTKTVEKMHEGKPTAVVVCEPRQIEKVIQMQETLRYPLADVSATRVPNREVANAQLPSILSVETLAVVSGDGKPVDPFWTRNLRDGVLVIVAPSVGGGSGIAAPMMMPPAGGYVPSAPIPAPKTVTPLPAPAAAPVQSPAT